MSQPQLQLAAIRISKPARLTALALGLAAMGAGGAASFVAHLEVPPLALLAAGFVLALVGLAGVMPTRLKAGDNEAEFLEQRVGIALKQGLVRQCQSGPELRRRGFPWTLQY